MGRNVGFKMEMIKLAELQRNPAQPGWRTESKTIAALRDSINASGLLYPLLVAKIGTQTFLVDGHRRKEALQELKIREAPCRVVEAASLAEAAELFARLADVSKPLSSADHFWGWASAPDQDRHLKCIPKGTAGNIRAMVAIFGEADAMQVALGKQSPALATIVYSVHKFMLANPRKGKPTPTKKKLGQWMLRNKQQDNARRLIKGTSAASVIVQKLHSAIDKDKPLPS